MPPRSRSKGRAATPSRANSKTRRAATPSKGRKATPSPAPRGRSPAAVAAGKSTPEKPAAVVDAPQRKFTPEKDKWDGHYEFGGVLGAIGIMIGSHFMMYYFWMCIEFFNGTVVYPSHPMWIEWAKLWPSVWAAACPTATTFGLFSAFLLTQYVLAVLLPGPVTQGLPLPSENNTRLSYKCNAVYTWYALLLIGGVLHYTDVFPLWTIRENFGHYMTAAIIWADIISVICFVVGRKRQIRMSGNLIYDFFMGSALNYRLPGDVDLKMFAEIRNSWMILFFLTCSCAAKMYKETGAINGNMAFMITAHFLYVNACQKGEECIPTTWDIYYEKFGWMLIYWNFAGVPFLYCFQSLYISSVKPTPQYETWVLVLMFVVLLAAYYIWDNVNSQKNRFRMKRQGVADHIIKRKTFPQLWWGYIENPRTIKSERGELFVDGWYRFGRKIHYTVDMVMAFLWGFSCGVDAFIPYFYFCFFVSHLTHRQLRDDERCREKYGPLWDEYIALVPYKFIPGVY